MYKNILSCQKLLIFLVLILFKFTISAQRLTYSHGEVYIVLIPNDKTTSIFDVSMFFIKPGDLVFDVGANRGTWTQEALKKTKQQVDAYLFEPSPDVFLRLKNIMAGQKNIRCFDFALSDKIGIAKFATNDGDALGSLVLRNSGELIDVAVDMLDNFCTNHKLARINFLKVDTEGVDARVIYGAQSLIQKAAIDFIQFEYGEDSYRKSGTTFVDLHTFLRRNNYYIFRIHGGGLIPQKNCLPSIQFCDFLAVHASKMYLLPEIGQVLLN